MDPGIEWEYQCSTLAVRNSHPRDVNIRMSTAHRYYLKGDTECTISGTGIYEPLYSKFDGKRISAAIFSQIERWTAAGEPIPEDKVKYIGMNAKEIQDSWEANGAAKRDAGTYMHQNAEFLLNGEPFDFNVKELSYIHRLLADHPWLYPYRTEHRVYDEQLRWCGTADILFKDLRTNNYILGDWKRALVTTEGYCKCPDKDLDVHLEFWGKPCSNFGIDPELSRTRVACNYNKYSDQLNIYTFIYRRRYPELPIDSTMLIILHAELYENYQIMKVEFNQSLVEKLAARRMQEPALLEWHHRNGNKDLEYYPQEISASFS